MIIEYLFLFIGLLFFSVVYVLIAKIILSNSSTTVATWKRRIVAHYNSCVVSSLMQNSQHTLPGFIKTTALMLGFLFAMSGSNAQTCTSSAGKIISCFPGVHTMHRISGFRAPYRVAPRYANAAGLTNHKFPLRINLPCIATLCENLQTLFRFKANVVNPFPGRREITSIAFYQSSEAAIPLSSLNRIHSLKFIY